MLAARGATQAPAQAKNCFGDASLGITVRPKSNQQEGAAQQKLQATGELEADVVLGVFGGWRLCDRANCDGSLKAVSCGNSFSERAVPSCVQRLPSAK